MSGIKLQPIKAILFDLDGTLVHSSLDFKQIRNDICCPEGEDVLSYLEKMPRHKRASAEQIIIDHELRDANAADIIPGAAQLLMRLANNGIKTAIITRNSAQATQIKLNRCGLKVENILTREDAPAKPDPSGLLHFSDMWNMNPSECVYVGDYMYDMQAANNANMHACLFLNGSMSCQMPSYAQSADFICRDFDSFEQDVCAYLGTV